MHEWLSGGVSPCQGEGRGFESRLVLFCVLTDKDVYKRQVVDGLLRGQRSKVEAAFTYYPGINEYMGQKTVQIIIQNYQ